MEQPEKQNRKQPKKWWQYLLIIPICLVVDVLLFFLAMFLDSSVPATGQGHPAPAWIIVVLFLCGIATVILTLLAIILCIRSIVLYRRSARALDAGEDSEPQVENARPIKVKPVWRCFIPLFVTLPLDALLLFFALRYDISSYQPTTQPGFPVPVVFFFAMLFCMLITLVVAVICIICAVVRAKRNHRAAAPVAGQA